MSANNWRVCPKCLQSRSKERAEVEATMHEVYGKAPLAEFEELKKKLDTLTVTNMPESLREDWELHTNGLGIFFVNYGCYCEECGFKFCFDKTINTLLGSK